MGHRRFRLIVCSALVSIIVLVLVGCPAPTSPGAAPVNAPLGVYYVGGRSAYVRRAADESDVDSYVLYWGTGPGAKLGGVAAQVTPTGDEYIEIHFSDSAPAGATYLLAYSANSHGEMSTGVSHRAVYEYTEHSLATDFSGAFCVLPADVDGDGDVDIVGAAYYADEVVWWENDEAQTWPVHPIDVTLGHAESVFAVDLDGDDDLDIACVHWEAGVFWSENDGTPADGEWTSYEVGNPGFSACSVSAADIDGDGVLDLVAASNLNPGGGIVWYEGDGSPKDGGWIAHAVNGATACRSVVAADIDKDGNLDLVGAMSAANEATWFRNDGSPEDGGWTEIVLGEVSGANDVFVADMDGDGYGDVVAIGTAESEVVWFENPGTLVAFWTAYPVVDTADMPLGDGRAVEVTDIDGDGDNDIAVASMVDMGLRWYENLIAANAVFPGGLWTSRWSLSTITLCATIATADIDNDGDIDIAGASWSTGRVEWWETE